MYIHIYMILCSFITICLFIYGNKDGHNGRGNKTWVAYLWSAASSSASPCECFFRSGSMSFSVAFICILASARLLRACHRAAPTGIDLEKVEIGYVRLDIDIDTDTDIEVYVNIDVDIDIHRYRY